MDDGYLEVFRQLVEAYHGINGFGSDTAEIYAYHLTPYLPEINFESSKEKATRDMGIIAHRRMVELCRQFERVMDCKLRFDVTRDDDGIDLDEWTSKGWPFVHRVHVRVEAT